MNLTTTLPSTNNNCDYNVTSSKFVAWIMNDTLVDVRTQYLKSYKIISANLDKDPEYLYSCSVPNNHSPSMIDPITGLFGFSMFAFISMVLTVIVAITILKNKKLRSIHPSTMIGLIATCEFIIAYNLLIYYTGSIKFACYFGLSEVWMFSINIPFGLINSIIGSMSDDPSHLLKLINEKDALKRLEWANITCFEVFQMLVLCLNIFLCIAIFKVFKDPFFPTRLRVKWYIICSSLIVCICYPFSKSILVSSDDFFKFYFMPMIECKTVPFDSKKANKHVYLEYLKTAVNTCIILVYMMIANYSISFVKNMQL